MSKSVFVETERLILRELVVSDAKGFFEMDSNPAVHKYLGLSPIDTIDEAIARINMVRQQYEEFGIGRWAIEEKSSGEFVGWSGLKFINTEVNNRTNFYDVGYRLCERFWGKGYATESAKAAIDYGFVNLNLDEIIGIANVHNKKSIHALQKCGLKFIEQFNFELWNTQCEWLSISKNSWLEL